MSLDEIDEFKIYNILLRRRNFLISNNVKSWFLFSSLISHQNNAISISKYHNAIALIQSPSNRHLCRLHISSFSAWANLTDKDNICFLLGCEYQRQQTYWIKQTMKEFVWKLKVALLQKVSQATVFRFTFQKSCSIHDKNQHILKK